MNDMPQALSHERNILNWLEQGNELTVIIAMDTLKCGSLSSCISRLRKQGYPILDKWEKNRTNKGSHKVYFLANLQNNPLK